MLKRSRKVVKSSDQLLDFLRLAAQLVVLQLDHHIDSYWEHTHLIIDVVPGRGGMFSLEGPTGKRFLTRSRVFTDEEYSELKNHPAQHAKDITNYEGLKTTS